MDPIIWLVISALTPITPIVVTLVFMRRAHRGKVLLLTGSAIIALWSILQILLTILYLKGDSLSFFPEFDASDLDGFSLVLLSVGLILLTLAAVRAGHSPEANQPVPGPAPLTPPGGPPASYPAPAPAPTGPSGRPAAANGGSDQPVSG